VKPATATAIEPPLGPSWWQRLGARIFGLPTVPALPAGPRLASGMVNGRYPPLEIFAVRDHYSGRLYCLRPPEDFTRGCGPILVTMLTKSFARAELFNTLADAQAFVEEHARRAAEGGGVYGREPFWGEVVRLAEVEEPRQ
jgi:hypothetical protein